MDIATITTTLSGYGSALYSSAAPYISAVQNSTVYNAAAPYVSGAYNAAAPYVSSAASYLPSMATLKSAGTTVITAATSTTGLVTIAAIATIVLATIAYRSITNFDVDLDFQPEGMFKGDLHTSSERNASVKSYQEECKILGEEPKPMMIQKMREGKITFQSRLPENWDSMTQLGKMTWLQERK